jgi:hypothetical protein
VGYTVSRISRSWPVLTARSATLKQPVVRLKIRVRLPDGSRPYLDPVPSAKGKLKPLFAFVDGNAEYHPEGVYFLRYARGGKRIWKHAGMDWQLALDAKLKQERVMAAQAVGVEVVHQTGKRLLSDAIVEYNAETNKHKAKRTHAAYSLTLALFQDAIETTYLEDISRDDLLTFIEAQREGECGQRTIFNRVRYIGSFLSHFKVTMPLKRNEIPKYTRKAVRAYGPEELKGLFAAATDEEAELFQFFLCTGCRQSRAPRAEPKHPPGCKIDERLSTRTGNQANRFVSALMRHAGDFRAKSISATHQCDRGFSN